MSRSVAVVLLLLLLIDKCVNAFVVTTCGLIVPSQHHVSTLHQRRHSFVSRVVVVGSARRRRADHTPTNNSTGTDTSSNPMLRGTRRKNFGQKRRTWMQNYEALLEYKRLHPHRSVPKMYDLDPPLGRWVSKLRMNGKESLSSEQLKLLDEAGFDWETKEERNNRLWQESYQKLIEYKEIHGDCCVPQKYKDDKGLGLWVNNQRTSANEGRMRVDREEQLDDIGFTWSLRNRPENTTTTHNDNMWNEKFERLLEFREEFGHCFVPKLFDEDPSLGSWVDNQRTLFKRGSLRRDRKDRLEEINFEFDPSNADENLEDLHWNSMFQHLVDYKDEHGDTNVKQSHEEFGLGLWVMTQRTNRSTMDEHRRKRLDGIGFVWSNSRITAVWQQRYAELCEYKKLHGTCRVKRNVNLPLAQWVCNQRYRIKQGKLSESKVKQLELIGFV